MNFSNFFLSFHFRTEIEFAIKFLPECLCLARALLSQNKLQQLSDKLIPRNLDNILANWTH